jgi:hypothetical protein
MEQSYGGSSCVGRTNEGGTKENEIANLNSSYAYFVLLRNEASQQMSNLYRKDKTAERDY